MAHPRVAAITSCAAALVLGGCATITKGPYATVPVYAPHAMTITDESGAPIAVSYDRDSIRHVKMGVDATRHIALENDSARFLYELEPRVSASWVMLDLFTAGLIGIAVDASTGAWRDFGDVAILFEPDSVGARRALVSADSMARLRRRPPIGIVVIASMGASNPVSQAVLFFNHYAGGIGYRIDDRATLLATIAWQGCLSLGDVQGTDPYRPHPYCTVSSTTLGGDVRVRLAGGWYAVGGAGGARVHVDTLLTDGAVVETRFTRTIPYASGGIGYSGDLVNLEVRYETGLTRLDLAGDVTAAYRLFTIGFGINVVI